MSPIASPANSDSLYDVLGNTTGFLLKLWVSNEHFYQISNLLHLHQSYAVYLEISQERFEQYPGSKMNFCYQISNLIAGAILCNIVFGNTTGCLLKLWVSNEHFFYQISNLLHPVTSTSSCAWKYHRKALSNTLGLKWTLLSFAGVILCNVLGNTKGRLWGLKWTFL